MSLSDDLAAMQRHQDNGTLREWFNGTAPALPPEPWPADPSTSEGLPTRLWIFLRGD